MLQMDEASAFEARKLDPETAARMGARYRGGEFQFDYLDNGALRYRKIRTRDKQFQRTPRGQKSMLWNLDGLRGLPSPVDGPLVITEGEMDAIAVSQAVGGYVVSVPDGGNGRRSKPGILREDDTGFAYLWGDDERLIPEIAQFDRIILAVDGDEPGTILRDELAMRIGGARCWFVEWPEDCKDANDVLMKHDETALRKVLRAAKPIHPGHLIKPSEAPPRKSQTTYSSGWECLDKHLMLTRPELCIVTGIPGHGKSQWVRALAFHQAKSHGLRTAFLTPEDPPYRLKRDMERFAKAGRTDVAAYDRESIARRFMDSYFMISNPPEDDLITLDMVIAEMESAALHYNCQIFVIDPWNEIAHNRGRQSDTEYIEQSLMMLKRKAFRLNMMLIIIAHPTKLHDGKKPCLYDISGSANWKNKCDHGIIIYRTDEEANIVQVIVEKSKDHEAMGKPGTALMEFHRGSADYTPA